MKTGLAAAMSILPQRFYRGPAIDQNPPIPPQPPPWTVETWERLQPQPAQSASQAFTSALRQQALPADQHTVGRRRVPYQWGGLHGLDSALAIIGVGAPIDDIISAVKLAADPIAVGKLVWQQIQGRSWDQAVASAYARAASKSWVKNDTASVNDLIVLIVSSAFNARQTKNPASADALNLTWVAFQKRMGIDASQVTLPQVQQKATQQNAGANILIPIAILGLILQVAVVGAVYAIAIYYAASLVNNYLAVSECDKELARLQAQIDAVTAKHNQDGLPLTSDEKDLQNQLLAQQQLVAGGCTKPAPLPTPPGFRQLPPGGGDEPQPPFSPWPYVIGIGILGTAAAGWVYRRQISDWLDRRRH